MNAKKGGKKGKAMKKFSSKTETRGDLQFKDEGQCYAIAIKILGDCRIELQCFDGIKRIGHIRGSMRNKVWITSGDVLLIGLRDFQDLKCDVILKYSPEEARLLKSYKELPESAKINENGTIEEIENSDEDIG